MGTSKYQVNFPDGLGASAHKLPRGLRAGAALHQA